MSATPLLKLSPERPSANASLRAWNGNMPADGSTASRTIALGSFAATSSISMPPDCDAMTTGSPRERSSVMQR